jgi:putative lipoic acid-binding regulatory protein
MHSHSAQKDLLTFPCHYTFKAFGPGDQDGTFSTTVQAAVSRVVPVSRHAMRARASARGTYQCVSVLVTLQSWAQLEAIYRELRAIDNLKYLL